MTLRIVNKKNAAKYEFCAKRRIKLNYVFTSDQNYILYYNNNKTIILL